MSFTTFQEWVKAWESVKVLGVLRALSGEQMGLALKGFVRVAVVSCLSFLIV